MKILGLSGSLRRDSHNTRLLLGRVRLLPGGAELVLFEELAAIPPLQRGRRAHGARGRRRPEATRSPGPTPCWWRPRSTTARSPGCSRTRSTGSPARLPSRPLKGKPAAVIGASTGLFGAVWAQAETAQGPHDDRRPGRRPRAARRAGRRSARARTACHVDEDMRRGALGDARRAARAGTDPSASQPEQSGPGAACA